MAVSSLRSWSALLFLALASGLSSCQHRLPPNSLATHDAAPWEKDIAAFEAADRTNPPPHGGIVFVGSSSIRLWRTLAQDFPDRRVINRGFGGSQLADAVKYADRLICPCRPRQVVIYAGGNDINAGKVPALVFGDFVALVTQLRSGCPQARLAYISIAPSPARWAQVEKVRQANALIAQYCHRHDIDFINVFPLMLEPGGQPKPDIYVADRLHLNAVGYAIWAQAVRPVLVRTE